MSAIMPGSANLEIFWRNIQAGKDMIREIPDDRWDWRTVCAGTDADPNKIKWGGFIEDVDKFDAQFFSISPREAALMDPQHRLFLSCVWKTIEDAGYKATELSGSKMGVFAGISSFDYYDICKTALASVDPYFSTGSAHSLLAYSWPNSSRSLRCT